MFKLILLVHFLLLGTLQFSMVNLCPTTTSVEKGKPKRIHFRLLENFISHLNQFQMESALLNSTQALFVTFFFFYFFFLLSIQLPFFSVALNSQGTAFVRCVDETTRETTCQETHCSDDEVQLPVQLFENARQCLDYDGYALCYTSSYSTCSPDIDGCRDFEIQVGSNFVYSFHIHSFICIDVLKSTINHSIPIVTLGFPVSNLVTKTFKYEI